MVEFTGLGQLVSSPLCVCYLVTLSLLRLYSISDRMVNEYGAVGGIRIGRGIKGVLRRD
jgi:hypothetical protein